MDEIEKLKKNGYKPEDYIASDVRKNVVNSLTNGTFSDEGTGGFEELYSSLIKGASWHKPDNYFVLYDLDGFIDAILKINRDYTDKIKFSAKQLTNTANSAYFSSDRTIKEYASDIWEI